MKKYILYIIAILCAGLAFFFEYYAFYDDSFLLFRWIPAAVCVVLMILFSLRTKTRAQWIMLILLLVTIPGYVLYMNYQQDRLNDLLYKRTVSYRGYYSQGFTTIELILYPDQTFLAQETGYMQQWRYTGTYSLSADHLQLSYGQNVNDPSNILVEGYTVSNGRIIPDHAKKPEHYMSFSRY